ncbi:conidiophore development protein hyma [Spiromyces aspiralis]|uniref:Conidiophore development protein hyma n=1 Tax=Spiromyces aspiralis TaxID=68401 RepID=A0ACC1HBK0_9FUNG|nr:conidiophore development protein hyma [Spiromyces aspiralis]
MNFLFKSKPKGPVELVKYTRDSMTKLETSAPSARDKASDEISRNISQMLQILREGGADKKNTEAASEQVAQLAQEIYSNSLLPLLITNMPRLGFETRKEISVIFGMLLRRKIGQREPTVEYLAKNDRIIRDIINGYANHDTAMFCGSILRECLKHESLAAIVIESPEFMNFFDYVEGSNFDIASDAFANFRDALTRFKGLASRYLQKNYDPFFTKYTELLNSNNYVIRRQSLKLLGEILLDRKNFNVMTRYISYNENLKLIMSSLSDKSKSIQYEAFHIFKIFVANPNKTPQIYNILWNNRDKLISYLSNFQSEKDNDEQFKDEKAFLVREVQKMRPPPATSGST